jgi:hypothetical protein
MTDSVTAEKKKNPKRYEQISETELYEIVKGLKNGPDSSWNLKKQKGVLLVTGRDQRQYSYTVKTLETLAIAGDDSFKKKVNEIKAGIEKANNPSKMDLIGKTVSAQINGRNGIAMIPGCDVFFDSAGAVQVCYNQDGTITLKK